MVGLDEYAIMISLIFLEKEIRRELAFLAESLDLGPDSVGPDSDCFPMLGPGTVPPRTRARAAGRAPIPLDSISTKPYL